MAERRGDRPEIPPGTVDMLILTTLAQRGPLHGNAIAAHIEEVSETVLRVEEGSLYPALQRMLVKGWMRAEWMRTATNRRARVYRFTAADDRKHKRGVRGARLPPRYQTLGGRPREPSHGPARRDTA